MERTVSNELASKKGEKVLVKGWLNNVRELGSISFVILRDRGGMTQVVVEDKKEIDKLKGLYTGTVLTVEGTATETDKTESGIEITEAKLTVEQPVKSPSPIDMTKNKLNVDLDTLLDYRSITLRHPRQQAIFKVQAGILEAFADSMRSQGFVEFRTPVLQASPSESGADVFEVKYFDQKAYLAQSPQIYKQIMTGVFERAFTIATVFRAEKHNTSRHLMEITQLDGEMAFINDYHDVLDVAEQNVRDILGHLAKNYQKELDMWDAKLPLLPESTFPKVRVAEAHKIIEERIGKSAQRDELDLDPEDEREIAKWAVEEHKSDFVWVLNFKKDKNFYTWNSAEHPEESLSYDLIARGLEWLSGTHRIHDYDVLLERLKAQGLKEEHYELYLQAFEYGMPSEAGYSFGLERMTRQIFELTNIREATLFPADLKRVGAMKLKREVLKGGENVRNAIMALLDSRAVTYEHAEHEETPTSEDAARIRGTKLEEGVKALILRGKKSGTNYLVAIPGDKKVDFKAVEEAVSEKVEMEKPEVILEKFGLVIGGIPPFGNLLGMQTFMDKGVLKTDHSDFNVGLRTESIGMNSADLLETSEATEGDYAK